MIMKTVKDSRQMPKRREYTANKAYSDIVYAWLQVNSEWDGEIGHCRTIPKSKVKFVDIANELDISRQTVSTKFKHLLDEGDGIGLVHYNDVTKNYELTLLPAEMAQLIENNTLRRMVSALNQNAISVYIYLFSRYCANSSSEFRFTVNQVKGAIGLSTSTRSNNYIITDILDVLQDMKLLTYEKVTEAKGGDIETEMFIKEMSNTTTTELKRSKKKC